MHFIQAPQRNQRSQTAESNLIRPINGADDQTKCRVDVFVLPYPYDNPPNISQQLVGLAIAFTITEYLPIPPVPVRDDCMPMHWAPMPEASVYEHGNAFAGERNVDAAPWAPRNRVVDSIPSTGCMEGSAKHEFRRGVALPLIAHAATDGFGTGNRGTCECLLCHEPILALGVQSRQDIRCLGVNS